MLVYGSIIAAEDIDLVVNAAAALFVLPFFLFSATAGTMADRFEKSSLIRKIKLAEIAIAMLAVTALYTQNIIALLAVLFLLGVQSTFFGPLKFSILPQHLHETELIGGNGVIEMGTFVAILLGTIMGGVIASMKGVSIGLSVMVMGVAIAGYLSSLRIPEAAPGFTDRPDWNPFRETVSLLRYAAEKKISISIGARGVLVLAGRVRVYLANRQSYQHLSQWYRIRCYADSGRLYDCHCSGVIGL